LIAHLAKTRAYTAGTILGSGTVSNAERARGYSCLAEQRALETIDTGAPKTPFLKHGDHVEIDMHGPHGSVCGRIDQRVRVPSKS
jgi:fumarylacetoacetate (FAA) hydrolase